MTELRKIPITVHVDKEYIEEIISMVDGVYDYGNKHMVIQILKDEIADWIQNSKRMFAGLFKYWIDRIENEE